MFLSTEEKNDLIYKLRNETGVGMMYCKKCLIDYNWDYKALFNNPKFDSLIITKTINYVQAK
jgi:hypothetical protein